MSTDRDLDGLDKLVAAYRRLPQPEPGPELDAAILAKARAALAPPRRGTRWPAMFATAAVVVLGVGITWQLRNDAMSPAETPLATDARETTPAADAGGPQAGADAPGHRDADVEAAREGQTRDDGVLDEDGDRLARKLPALAEQSAAAPPPAPAPEPIVSEVPKSRAEPVTDDGAQAVFAEEKDQFAQDAVPARRQNAAPPAAMPAPAPASPFPADAKEDRGKAIASGEAGRARATPPESAAATSQPKVAAVAEPQAEMEAAPVPSPIVAEERGASERKLEDAPVTPRDAVAKRAAAGTLGSTAPSAAQASEPALEEVVIDPAKVKRIDDSTDQPVFVVGSRLDPAIQRDAKRWLREIRALRERGELERAREELWAFRKAWPRERVPRALEDLER